MVGKCSHGDKGRRLLPRGSGLLLKFDALVKLHDGQVRSRLDLNKGSLLPTEVCRGFVRICPGAVRVVGHAAGSLPRRAPDAAAEAARDPIHWFCIPTR